MKLIEQTRKQEISFRPENKDTNDEPFIQLYRWFDDEEEPGHWGEWMLDLDKNDWIECDGFLDESSIKLIQECIKKANEAFK